MTKNQYLHGGSSLPRLTFEQKRNVAAPLVLTLQYIREEEKNHKNDPASFSYIILHDTVKKGYCTGTRRRRHSTRHSYILKPDFFGLLQSKAFPRGVGEGRLHCA